ncbi:hypothetical protein EVAR_84950_1 [Eumeta japonica]|uniref:O-acyltransferase WSD1 C-terminal domain-containing protein n=1 Tax=Eumeta variegata TaxID=151549 RepID=A0A4C1VH31_EUMVA|nr:hypothetical protein EVAR_84950_1 [Eumeta japonica]
METPKGHGLRARLADHAYTYCVFWLAVCTLPALAFSFIVVRMTKNLWLRLLSSRYPHLEFIRIDTVRSLLDTHRNQGIINVLLCLQGQMDINQIRAQLLQHVVERRDKRGELMFPRLRHTLVSCWGNYAWDVHPPFRLENHFLLAAGVHRGRPIADNNIQEYVSEIVSKYFPSEQPPWQYIVIPCMSEEAKYYVLVRVHHLLLTGKNSINIGDLLLVRPAASVAPSAPIVDHSQPSPLTRLFPTPSAIPQLFEKINEMLSNTWNEFVSEYDPIESPSVLKSAPGIFHVAGLTLVAGACALRDLTKRHSIERDANADAATNATSLITAIYNECRRRELTVTKVLLSPWVTADPRKWPRRIFSVVAKSLQFAITMPVRMRDEISALRSLHDPRQIPPPHTLTCQYAGLIKLCGRAAMETFRGALAVYQAPAQLWTDTMRTDDGRQHALQTVSLCGRKVTAWSQPVSRTGVERAARALGVSTTDVALYAATEALRAYFEHVSALPPDVVLATARAHTQDFLFTFAEGEGKYFKKSQTGGMVCLTLPVGASPRRIHAVVRRACERQGALAGAWAAQARCGALTRALPSPVARIALNVLSRRYAVSYAEINAPPDSAPRNTLWGQQLDYIIYWRPPQANISMSLTVIQYADTIRMSVMSDARLSPVHAVPATRWPTVVEQLVSKVDQEIARITAEARTQRDTQTISDAPAQQTTNIPPKIKTSLVEVGVVPLTEEEEMTGSLRPPAVPVDSPPPARRITFED